VIEGGMSSDDDVMMAACGLLCGECDIRRMPLDDEAARITIDWYREMGWLTKDEGVKEAVEKNMICTGCHGDRSTHWSPDCWILKCCVGTKDLKHCHQCTDFPCEKLKEWSKQNAGYTKAFERLKQLHSREPLSI